MQIDKFKIIVIKIGSSILIDEKGNPKKIYKISALKHQGITDIKKVLVRYVH